MNDTQRMEWIACAKAQVGFSNFLCQVIVDKKFFWAYFKRPDNISQMPNEYKPVEIHEDRLTAMRAAIDLAIKEIDGYS